MRNLSHVFVLFMALALGFTACTSEEIQAPTQDSNVELTAKQIIDQQQADINQFATTFPDAHVEFTSLEKLNETLVAAGMEPTSLEALEITPEEYATAQEQINNPEASTIRCTGTLAVYFGDINNNGVLSSSDLPIFQQCILGNCSVSPGEYSNFGYLSAVWGYGNPSPSTFDLVVAQRIILGILPCY